VQTGFRNAIINGEFNIWQRGTSFIGTGYNYCADRWMEFRNGFATGMTATRQLTGLSGFQYGIRLQRDSGNTGTQPLNLQQTLETVNSIPFQGKTVTVSFYARVGANFSASGINLYIHTGQGVDQAASNQNFAWTTPQTYTQAFTGLTTTWARYTFTTTLSSTLTQLGIKLDLTPTGTAGANDWIEFTGFQLEQGSIATPFEQRPIGTELALCQRYYWAELTQTYHIAILDGGGAQYPGALITHPVPMRTVPELTALANGLFYYNNGGEVSFTPASGSWGYEGGNTFGRATLGGISNAPGSTHAQKYGQWNVRLSFSAEL
jgi:hypothetical protein